MNTSNKDNCERYDGIDMMDTLQIVNELWSNNNSVDVYVAWTLSSFVDIMDKSIENDLSISPFDYYQLENGTLIKKETSSEYINTIREDIYDFLCDTLWENIIDSYLVILHNVVTLDYINDFTLKITDEEIKENLFVLSVIELEIIWKKNLARNIIDILLKNSNYLDTYRVLGYYLYHVWEYSIAHKFLTKLVKTDFIKKDKELLTKYIILNKLVNNDEWIDELLYIFSQLLDSEYDSDNYNPDSFYEDLKFVHANYLYYYLKLNNNLDNLEEAALVSIELWNQQAYFHLIYACLQKKDYEKASDYYNNWELVDDENEIVFSENNLIDLEQFYILWIDIWVLWSMDLLVNFYKDQFTLYWYNEEYFNSLIEYVLDWQYDFTNNDDIFFEAFSIEMQKLDNDSNILNLIDILFDKYFTYSNPVYLEKMLLVLSKQLHNKYKNHLDINIKRTFTIWFENIIISNKCNLEWITDIALFNNMVKEKAQLLSDIDYLNARFNELVLKFCSENLEIIDSFPKKWNIPIYLASIFDYYWLLDSVNIALWSDEFFKIKKAPRLN